MILNQDVVGSNPTGGVYMIYRSYILKALMKIYAIGYLYTQWCKFSFLLLFVPPSSLYVSLYLANWYGDTYILLTPKEGLSKQHLDDFKESNISAEILKVMLKLW